MQQFVKEVETEMIMPKGYREQLDELEVGKYIPLESEEEKEKFNSVMYRDFHSKPKNQKLFSIRTDRKTKLRAIWRLK